MTISNGSTSVGESGGGIRNNDTGTVNVTNCTLSGNNAGSRGRSHFELLRRHNQRHQQHAQWQHCQIGGGIKTTHRTVNVTNSTISGNSGGGLNNSGGTMNVTNCTVSGNSGGAVGISNFNTATVNVTNSTISSNFGTNFGALRNGPFASANVKSSIIALNTGGTEPDVNGVFTSSGFNLIGKNDGAAASFPAGRPNANNDIVGTSASPVNPQLDPNGLQDNGGSTQTIALLSGSPAIDKGTSNGLTGNLTTDQRGTGFPRTFDYPFVANAAGGNGTDIGAFELLVPFSVSRKMHGAAAFDIDLPLTGTAGIECRTGGVNGDHQVITTFPSPVSVTTAM